MPAVTLSGPINKGICKFLAPRGLGEQSAVLVILVTSRFQKKRNRLDKENDKRSWMPAPAGQILRIHDESFE
jgi:hypothetical protein